MRDFQRPRYFNPYEAKEYGLIDTVRGCGCGVGVGVGADVQKRGCATQCRRGGRLMAHAVRCAVWTRLALTVQVLEPRDEKSVEYKGWEALGSEISQLGLWEDSEQPLPTNVMYPGVGLGVVGCTTVERGGLTSKLW